MENKGNYCSNPRQNTYPSRLRIQRWKTTMTILINLQSGFSSKEQYMHMQKDRMLKMKQGKAWQLKTMIRLSDTKTRILKDMGSQEQHRHIHQTRDVNHVLDGR